MTIDPTDDEDAPARLRIYRADDSQNAVGEALATFDTEMEVVAFPRRLDWRYVIYEQRQKVSLQDLKARIWTCPICDQSVVKRPNDRKPILPPGYFETCKLRDQMIGEECIARRDVEAAKKLPHR